MKEILWSTADRDPYAAYADLRAKEPVAWDEDAKCWVVTSFPLVRHVMNSDDLFVQPYNRMQAGDAFMKMRSGNARSVTFLRGEPQRKYHRWWVSNLLSPARVKDYGTNVIEPVVAAQLDRIAALGKADLVSDFAEHIPIRVLVRLLDLPDQGEESIRHLKRLNNDTAAFAEIANSLRLEGAGGEGYDEIIARAMRASEELNELLVPTIEARRGGEGDDFISQLWRGGPKIFEDWNDLDMLDGTRRLLFAGSDTTTHAIANAFHWVLTHPDTKADLIADPARIPTFVEEIIRLHGSVEFRPRRAAEDVELGGVQIREGDIVLAMLVAANRDPDQFGCPAHVDLDRANPKNHMSFSTGPRSCPGATLARAEVATTLEMTLARFPDIRLDPAGPEPVLRGLLSRSYRPVPALLTA